MLSNSGTGNALVLLKKAAFKRQADEGEKRNNYNISFDQTVARKYKRLF